MNNYNDWAKLVAKKIKAEADLMAAIDKDGLSHDAAREAFVRAVLKTFLPQSLGIGSGRVIDARGNQSEHFDIVVYSRDFPRMTIQEAQTAYLYESVLATFVVRSKFIRKTIFDALDVCASLAPLQANLDKPVLAQLAKKNGVRLGANQTWEHDDPMQSARFDLIARPPAFLFGFGGIKNSYRQLQENIELWISNRDQDDIATPMKSLPAVIATQGCFAWRNAAPLALSNREMLGLGCDEAPVRLIVLQLLYLLNRRLRPRADGYGLKPDLARYLSQFPPPTFEVGVGDIEKSNDKQSPDARQPTNFNKPTISARYKPARDHSSEASRPETNHDAKSEAAASDVAARSPEPAAAAIKPAAPEQKVENKPVEEKPAEMAAEFTRPSPFASAPIPPMEDAPAEVNQAPARSPFQSSPLGSAPIPDMNPGSSPQATEKPPASPPLGSAPVPGMAEPAAASAATEKPPLSAPLGSAPIPPMAAPEPSAPEADSVIPPKPPVDFDLGAADTADQKQGAATASTAAADEEDFTNTVIIPPDAAASKKDQSRNSTDAFIARVKEQLSSTEAMAEAGQDPFSSTIPQ